MTKYILSIDGGGIRGLIPATILMEIERRMDKPVAEIFDLIAGTSTGGILALGLSVDDGLGAPKLTAEDLRDLYLEHGQEIFHRSLWKGAYSVAGLADERYSHDALENLLKEYVGQAPLSAALVDVLISSYDILGREPWFFKSWPGERNTRAVPMWQVARATSAAPTYFEPIEIAAGSAVKVLVDGGVFVNNPAMSAYAEGQRLYPGEELVLVSLGTGQLTRPISHHEAKDWGLVQWALPILNVVFDGVSDAVDYQLNQILGPEHFFRFQIMLGEDQEDMDNVTYGNMRALQDLGNRLVSSQAEKLEKVYALLAGD